MERHFVAEEAKFGVTAGDALESTHKLIKNEVATIDGLTNKLKGYMCDLEGAFKVFEAQERHKEAKTQDEKRKKEAELIMLRAQVNN